MVEVGDFLYAKRELIGSLVKVRLNRQDYRAGVFIMSKQIILHLLHFEPEIS
jgi:hypothetical protein